MTTEQLRRLTDNIKQDGTLTSVPLCWREAETIVVGSGNHRVLAAINANFNLIDVMIITSEISEQQKIAIQLSHNAIVGQDDTNILFELYSELDLDNKIYSGINDADFDGLKVDVSGLSLSEDTFLELNFVFLKEDAEAFEKKLKEIKEDERWHVGKYDDFDIFFQTVLDIKERYNILNSSLALKKMADLALLYLNEHEKKDESPD